MPSGQVRGTSPAAAAQDMKQRQVVADLAAKDEPQETPPAAPMVDDQVQAIAGLLAKMLPGIVAAEVDRVMSRVPEGFPPPSSPVLFADKTEFSVEAERHAYAATYRCDTMPTLRMVKFDFIKATELAEPHTKHLIPGEFIEFYNGIFQTDDQNEIMQLSWAAGRQSNTGGIFGKTIGGNPFIYKVTGGTVLKCPHKGCQFAATSQADIDGHFRATHTTSS